MKCGKCGARDAGDCRCGPIAFPAEPNAGQLDLFSGPTSQHGVTYPAPPFQRHSDTSRDAAQDIEPAAATERGRVLCILRGHPDGLTDEEMQQRLEMNPSTQRPRRIELCRAGHVVDSGDRRLTDAGRRAVVWIAND